MTKEPRRLHCNKCNLTFRQEQPPFNEKFVERVTCSDCNHFIDTWDEGDVVVTSKGPPKDILSRVGEWEERQAAIFADIFDCDEEEYFRP